MPYTFFLKQKLDILVILLLCLTAPLFFYKLGQSSLVSWDEAWYAEISRNILRTGEILQLSWNGKSFFDHPPVAFWITALIFKFAGISDFTARAGSAVMGVLSLIFVYFLGKEMFNRSVGFASAIALSSSFWFIYRARSGNLDIALTMFFLLTILLAIKASRKKFFLLPCTLSLIFLVLTKTLVPFVIIPTLIVIFWKAKEYNISDFKLPSMLFLLVIGGWIIVQLLNNPAYLNRYFGIGLPGVNIATNYVENFNLIKEYLHSGVGRWFWPGILSVFLSLIFCQRRFYILTAFFLTFFIPFIFSEKGHIWHLVPLHPIMILSFFGFSYLFLEKILKKEILASTAIFAICAYFSFIQIRQIWYQIIDIPAYISDEAILSKEAGKYSENFFIDGDFVPTAVYYSGKNVDKIYGGGLAELFEEQKGFVLITNQGRIDGAHISKDNYSIIKSDRDKILVISQDK